MQIRIVIASALSLLISSVALAADALHRPPAGFVALFNGSDLPGWHGMDHFDLRKLRAMSAAVRTISADVVYAVSTMPAQAGSEPVEQREYGPFRGVLIARLPSQIRMQADTNASRPPATQKELPSSHTIIEVMATSKNSDTTLTTMVGPKS